MSSTVEKEIVRLRAEIERHNELYYQRSAPEISDREFDQLLERLKGTERSLKSLAGGARP